MGPKQGQMGHHISPQGCAQTKSRSSFKLKLNICLVIWRKNQLIWGHIWCIAENTLEWTQCSVIPMSHLTFSADTNYATSPGGCIGISSLPSGDYGILSRWLQRVINTKHIQASVTFFRPFYIYPIFLVAFCGFVLQVAILTIQFTTNSTNIMEDDFYKGFCWPF